MMANVKKGSACAFECGWCEYVRCGVREVHFTDALVRMTGTSLRACLNAPPARWWGRSALSDTRIARVVRVCTLAHLLMCARGGMAVLHP